MTEHIINIICTAVASLTFAQTIAGYLNLRPLHSGLLCAAFSILIGHFLEMK